MCFPCIIFPLSSHFSTDLTEQSPIVSILTLRVTTQPGVEYGAEDWSSLELHLPLMRNLRSKIDNCAVRHASFT
ncbi:hypothetical protein BCON_0158g00200 [Botryotinia convoluta]|uniref:Uncharacterized protein n=1 Tax=Botryotinia convoluta TaxID=54673 RepID=A0A4Z1HS07_9HELO|nr:hypothetical protein BCON_0158g00200 [Botryotinia convoluta]